MRRLLAATASVALLSNFVGLPEAGASQILYQAVNPNFGGSPFNGPWLFSEANANNFRYLTNPATAATNNPVNSRQQAIQNFQDAVTNSLLGQIAQQIAIDVLGQNGQTSGHFNIGGELIDFNRANGQININITDPVSGGVTNLQVPVPSF